MAGAHRLADPHELGKVGDAEQDAVGPDHEHLPGATPEIALQLHVADGGGSGPIAKGVDERRRPPFWRHRLRELGCCVANDRRLVGIALEGEQREPGAAQAVDPADTTPR